ncbi:mechanosensitive ion channel family protein [Pseudoalteromonas sp. SG44-5]|uniref:mechanosensitive ion channel family protein n=1 Tax=Pseudoalteromonas sp. SG44-5 TaxID=2760960 RepID=UPI0015F7D65D|nr:mechanosensitive ion channel family protein [Pseudoalteromonas sp. SG44-5]MBB1405249.1 mechanosensitive ion channel family protein [Pseudoalteromonas sp. SG44-5]
MKDKLLAFWQSHSETIITLGYKVILALVILIASGVIARAVKRAVNGSKSPLNKLDKTLLPIISRLSSYLVYIIGSLFILDIFGVNTASLVALMAAAGLAIGLALKSTLSNIAAGIMLLILRPFKVGDFIDASGTSGTVSEINLFTTIFKTTDGLYIASPNGKVWGGNIKNFTRNGKRRMDIVVGISYADSIDDGLNVLKQIASSEERLLAEPAPKVMVVSIAESSVNLQLRAWTVNGDYWQTVWDLNKRVKESIEQAGLTIPFPQRTLHLPESLATSVTINKDTAKVD